MGSREGVTSRYCLDSQWLRLHLSMFWQYTAGNNSANHPGPFQVESGSGYKLQASGDCNYLLYKCPVFGLRNVGQYVMHWGLYYILRRSTDICAKVLNLQLLAYGLSSPYLNSLLIAFKIQPDISISVLLGTYHSHRNKKQNGLANPPNGTMV